MLIHLGDVTKFDELIKGEEVLVDFFATWCGPCKMLAPELEDLAEENPEITVVKIDVDQFRELSARFRIQAVPTLFVFKNGEMKKTISGFMDKDALKNFVKNA